MQKTPTRVKTGREKQTNKQKLQIQQASNCKTNPTGVKMQKKIKKIKKYPTGGKMPSLAGCKLWRIDCHDDIFPAKGAGKQGLECGRTRTCWRCHPEGPKKPRGYGPEHVHIKVDATIHLLLQRLMELTEEDSDDNRHDYTVIAIQLLTRTRPHKGRLLPISANTKTELTQRIRHWRWQAQLKRQKMQARLAPMHRG